MNNFEKIKSGFNIDPILADLKSQPGLWRENLERQSFPGSPHKDTETIFLRWCKGRDFNSAFTEIPAIFYPAAAKLQCLDQFYSLILDMVGSSSQEDLGRILLVNLKPGGLITKHSDEGAYSDHYQRFHLCLTSAPENSFTVEDEPDCGEFVHMKPGELWWFNHKKVHTVWNGSAYPRIHLIVDAVAPRFRERIYEGRAA